MEEDHSLIYKAIVIGGSAGSLSAILEFIPFIKSDLRLAIIIVLHRKPTSDSLLVDILSVKTSLRVKEAEDKEKIKPGTIYIAPPGYHLLIEKDHTFSLDDSEKVNYSRPSIDITFESAALAYGPSLAGILLSGANADGTDGLKAIAEEDGTIIIQDPKSADIPFMPANAAEHTIGSKLIRAADIAALINNLPS